MDNCISGELFLYDNDMAKNTIGYLQKIGLNCDIFKRTKVDDYHLLKNKYIIEFKEKPSILKTLEYIGIYNEENPISINNIDENGVGFYVIGQYLGDGMIFVPMSNIKAIYNVMRDQINRHIYYQECNS